MTSWYDILSLNRPSSLTVAEARAMMGQGEIRDSVDIITALIDEEVASLNG